VFFRAPSFDVAGTVLGGLLGGRLLGPTDFGLFGRVPLALVASGLLTASLLHATATLATRAKLHRGRLWVAARPLVYFAVGASALLVANRGPQQFIYFQF